MSKYSCFCKQLFALIILLAFSKKNTSGSNEASMFFIGSVFPKHNPTSINFNCTLTVLLESSKIRSPLKMYREFPLFALMIINPYAIKIYMNSLEWNFRLKIVCGVIPPQSQGLVYKFLTNDANYSSRN